jgi:Type IV secretion-system coupling protein DNA-binding domain
MAGRLPPDTIRTRWEDGAWGFAIGAVVGGAAALAVIETLAPLPESIFTHAKIWSFGVAHAFGINLGNWQSYSNYMQQLADAGQPLEIPARMATTAISAAAGACMLAWQFGKPRNSLIFHSGAKVLRGKVALKAVEKGTGIEIAPGFILTHKRERSHILIAGSTGVGKSVVGWHIMLQAKKRGDRILLIDFKGFTENWPIKNGDTAMLCPTHKFSRVWAIAKDVKTKQDARQLAGMFIVESKDPTWSNAARQILVGCIMKLIGTKGVGAWGWRDLADLVVLTLPDLKTVMKEYYPEGLITVDSGKPSESAAFSLSAYTSIIFDLADAWENRLDGISIKDWVRNPNSKIRTIIMQINTEFSELSAAFNAAIVNQVESCLSSLPDLPADKNPLWLFADEAPQLGVGLVKGWNNFLVVGRSKSLRVIMSVQSRSQLDEMAGDNLASTWIDSIGTKIIGSLDGEGAKWASDLLGETVYLRPTYTTSANGKESIQWSQQVEPTFKPAQIMGELGELEGGAGVRMIIHGYKSRSNVKLLNTLIKYIPQFESFKSPIELVVDFPFPKIGRKDRTPLRPQTVLADFCINADELITQRKAKLAEIAATNSQQRVVNSNIPEAEIIKTKEIIQLNNTQVIAKKEPKTEFEDNLKQNILSHLGEVLLQNDIVETALHIAEVAEVTASQDDGAQPTVEHIKKRKIIRKKTSEYETEVTS